MSEAVIAAMEAAVAADPQNPSLREHLASLLVESGRMDDAWTHAVAGLTHEPANTSLLRVAATSGEATGRDAEAAGYRTLLNALDPGGAPPASGPAAAQSSASTPPSTPPPPAPTAPSSSDAAPPPWHSTQDSDSSDDLPFGNDNNDEDEERERRPIPDGEVPDSVDDLLDMWGDSDAAPEPTVGEMTRDRLYLRDVGGMEDVKKRLQVSFLAPMKNPEMRQAFGKSMRGGLLLWGPPGCGKTFIAKAVAGELDANFYHVGLSDVLDMWTGSSEKNVTQIFEIARRNSPCVLFLDEVDALGQKRTHLRGGSGMRGVVNQLLQEMDGATSDNEGVFVLAATNHPWDIDSALLRPGRLDRSVLVLPPDLLARESILELHLRGKPVEKLDLQKVAKHTNGLTGADLSLLCEQATEYAMTDSIETGTVRPITMKDLGRATKEVRPSHGPWIESAKNYAMFNNEDGRYDDLLIWIKQNKIK